MKGLEQNVVIELRHLRYFLAVYGELHFGRAAARLHMAQPPLSQAIRKLEEALGLVLFERTSRSVKPTEAGHALAEGAQKVLATFDQALASARIAGGATRTLRIGCIPTLPVRRLLQFLASLQQRMGDSTPRVMHLPSAEQLRHLRAGDLDLAICHQSEDYENLEAEPLFPGEPVTVLLRSDHRLVDRPVVRLSDLTDEPLVTYRRTQEPGLYDRVLALADESGYRFGAIEEAAGSNPRDLILAVVNGSGVALVPASITELSDSRGIAVQRPLDQPLRMPGTIVAWAADRSGIPLQIVEAVRELSRDLYAAAAMRPG